MDNSINKIVSSPQLVPLSFGKSVGGEVLNIGLVGTGGFANFVAKVFSQIPGVRIIAVTDINNTASYQIAKENKAIVYNDLDELLGDENIDLVYIATPPYIHYQQSRLALENGKHVICEKPAALKTHEAQELTSLASSKKLLYVVNLMQRYNPLYKAVDEIIKEKILGNFLHGFFENYASDENLNDDHWFWDETKSGGIFIEHGVHFFDIFSGWLGEGKVVNALRLQRFTDKEKIIDRVQATVLYETGIVNFYHGFDQPKILDRQEMRLQFERGDITLYEWVPVKIKLHGLVTDEQLDFLKKLLPGSIITNNPQIPGGNQKARGRFMEINFDKEITLEYGNASAKQDRYEQIVKSMFNDQWNWIKDRNHKRIITDGNAIDSLRMAEHATKIAQTLN